VFEAELPLASFMPHGYCISWRPGLLWTLVLSDAAIALSYFAIPAALYSFTRRHKRLPAPPLFFFFCAFIVACGTTHALEVVSMWRPIYHIVAGAKVSTAVVSAATAVLVWPMLHHASRLIEERASLQEQLSLKNQALASALAEAEQRKAAVERSDAAFRATIMSAPIGMAMVSLQGTFLMVNKALCQMLGYAASELERMTFHELTHADDLDADLLHVASLIDGLASSYRMEKRYLHKDGRAVYAQLDVVLIRGDDSAPSHFIAQIQDITSRKQMESALLETRHRYRTLLDNLPTAVVVHRADTTIEYANPRFVTTARIDSGPIARPLGPGRGLALHS
jgi:PAS domain S-box-containing protein